MEGGHPRSVEAITTDINRAFERAVRKDPANWFWVHNRWKPFRSRSSRANSTIPVAEEEEQDPAVPLG
jgi:KDO2-lipid IV(A) lauroyltransferase